jgi:SAM-dependent methyltransferase
MLDAARLDRLNRSTMRASARYYATLSELGDSEKAALASIADEVRNRRILDVGVGGGRTVGALRELSPHYLGIDYVEEMVAACRARFPGVAFERADARDLTRFADGAFDLIVFAWCGLCMVDHEGRMAILRELHRVLSPGGYFVFSTYNRNSAEHDRLFALPELSRPETLRGAVKQAASFGLHTAMRLFNRLRYLRREIVTAEYSIINDKSHDYRTMLYYLTLEEQKRQLAKVGFRPNPRVYARGRQVESDDGSLGDSMLFVAQR